MEGREVVARNFIDAIEDVGADDAAVVEDGCWCTLLKQIAQVVLVALKRRSDRKSLASVENLPARRLGSGSTSPSLQQSSSILCLALIRDEATVEQERARPPFRASPAPRLK